MSPTSPWSPLQHKVFRALWTAGLVSYIGVWMQNVGAAWLMTSLTTSPLMVALIQTATTLPAFLLSLPGGMLADLMDRRRLLLFTSGWMVFSVAAIAALTFSGDIGPWSLLALTFALGAASALQMPAWQSTTSDTLPRTLVPTGIALAGISYNVARAVGPALAGVIIASFGSGVVFAVTTLCYMAMFSVLLRWQSPPRRTSDLPPESMLGGIQSGLRYVRHSPPVLGQILRTVITMTCASALWALLPVAARAQLGLDAGGYGLLLTCLGGGAVLGAMNLARLRERFGTDRTVNTATFLFALAMFCLAFVKTHGIVYVALVGGGFCWLCMTAVSAAVVQTSVPTWVRARVVSIFFLSFQASMAIGAVLWGSIASHLDVSFALAIAAGFLVVTLPYARRYRLKMGSEAEVTPSMHWTQIAVDAEPDPEDGPVAVQIAYRINPAYRREFSDAAYAIRRIRQRDGATSWRLYKDLSDPSCYIERFVVDSWAEYLRQQARATLADKLAQERVFAFHVAIDPPQMRHFIMEPPPHI